MPDPLAILTMMSAAAALAAAIMSLCVFIARSRGPSLPQAGAALAVGAGFLVGCLLLGIRVIWPPATDQERLLVILIPTAILVEAIAAFTSSQILHAILRFLLAAAVTPIVLYGSVYLTDAAGPGTQEWPFPMNLVVLTGFALAIFTHLMIAAAAQRRVPSRWSSILFAAVLLATGVTMMISGYNSGGQSAMPVAAALVAVAVVSLLTDATATTGGLLVAIVLQASLLVAGHFFGSLTTTHAAVLFLAPLGYWLPALLMPAPRVWLRIVLQTILTLTPVTYVGWQAYDAFMHPPRNPNSPANDGSLDYSDYYK